MILHEEMLQQLVDKIIDDIGYNINIIDREGNIVASGSYERIGTFHAIGYEAAINEKRIDILPDDIGQHEGVREGINQPFYYHDQLVGVIGITGKVSEIEEFVRVVKTMIELMVEQEMLKQRMFHRSSNKSYFANLLLNCKTEEDLLTLTRWASKLGYDLNVHRTVLVVTVGGVNTDQSLPEVLKLIKKLPGHVKKDFTSILSTNQIFIYKTHNNKYPYDELETYSQNLLHLFKEIMPSAAIRIGVGSHYDKLEDQRRGYEEAIFCLRAMKGSNKRIGHIEDYLLEYLVNMIEPNLIEHFISDYMAALKDAPELIETVAAFMRHQMSLVKTAEALFVHRNTVVFRLNKIKEITGLDPAQNHKDRIICHLLVAMFTNANNLGMDVGV